MEPKLAKGTSIKMDPEIPIDLVKCQQFDFENLGANHGKRSHALSMFIIIFPKKMTQNSRYPLVI